MKTPHRIGRFLEHDRGERNPLNTHSLRTNYSKKEREREIEDSRDDASRWIDGSNFIAIDRLALAPPREIPLTPKKYEFLSSREKSVDIPRIRVYIYIYPLAIVRHDSFCRTRSYVSRGISTIPKVGSFCVQGSFCSRPDTSIV